MFRDKFGRPLPLHDDLSERAWDRRRIEGQERSARHKDWAERARPLVDINKRGLLRDEAHNHGGLPRGSLGDQSLATKALRVALARLRTIPM